MSVAPCVSILLLAYNQRETIEEAVSSCLAQTGPAIEIILSDDSSTDGTGELLASLGAAYRGPHRVRVNRNPINLGIGAHLNKLVELSDTELLLVAAGDDLSLPHRAQAVFTAWEASQRRLDLIASNLIDIDAQGNDCGVIRVDELSSWHSVSAWVARRPYVVGAGHAWTRRLFQRFGPLRPGIAYEDQVMTFRALACGGATTLRDPLVRYRRGGTSAKVRPISADAVRSRIAMQNLRHLAEAEQLLADARVGNCPAAVTEVLARESRKQQYLRSLLDARDSTARAACLARAHDVPIAWRWRKFAQVEWAGLKGLQNRLRR